METVYTISSDESDDDAMPVTETGGKETCGDHNADQMDHESNPLDNIDNNNDPFDIGETEFISQSTGHLTEITMDTVKLYDCNLSGSNQLDHESDQDNSKDRSLQNDTDMSDDLDAGENDVIFDQLDRGSSNENLGVGENGLFNSYESNFAANDSSSSSLEVDMEPVGNTAGRNSAGSQKGKKTSNKAIEKQIKKQQLADEKLAKKRAAEWNKIYKPGDCMRYMNIEGHPSLLSRWYMADVPREVGATGAHLTQSPSVCDPGLLVWSRTLPQTLGTEGGQVRLTPLRERCNRAVYIADAEELCEMVSSHTLSPHLSQMRQLCDCRLTLIAFNVNEYFKKKGRGSQKSVHSGTRRKTSNSNRTPMTEIDFQLAVTDLLVTADCDTLIVNTSSELALSIVQLTKAIAEAPLKQAKRACDEKAGFYMRGDNKNCISVDKNGVGVSRLWQQMLAILPQSSLETSRAICAQYKSPLELYESFQSLPADQSIAKLADIGVSRAAVDGSRARRVGPGLARKLHTLFTARNGDQIIE